jgi:hypothetical protein
MVSPTVEPHGSDTVNPGTSPSPRVGMVVVVVEVVDGGSEVVEVVVVEVEVVETGGGVESLVTKAATPSIPPASTPSTITGPRRILISPLAERRSVDR